MEIGGHRSRGQARVGRRNPRLSGIHAYALILQDNFHQLWAIRPEQERPDPVGGVYIL